MHIGFDVSQAGSGKAGCGFFAHSMIHALLQAAPGHRYSLYPSFGDFYFDPRMPLRNPYAGPHVAYGPRHLTREAAAEFWGRASLDAALGSPDVVHSNNYWCPTTLGESRLIYTCYDLSFAVDPRWTTEANRVGCFDGIFRASVAADWIVAISRASRAHYLAVFPHFPEERIRVIHPGSRFAPDAGPGRRPRAAAALREGAFWLSVGTIEPRKNQVALARAYARYLALGGPAMPLVFAGGEGWLMDDFRERLRALGIAEQVLMTGYVSDDELIWLYRGCRGNLYPSLFEGFGLPVLEGLQLGAPTIASNTTALPEVAGDAALLLAPDDTEGWARAMLRIARDRDERRALSERGPAQAARFDAAASARQLLELYEEAAAAPKRAPAHPA